MRLLEACGQRGHAFVELLDLCAQTCCDVVEVLTGRGEFGGDAGRRLLVHVRQSTWRLNDRQREHCRR